MKKSSRQIPGGSLEILEARIAPAAVFAFTDTDGDSVTVSSSRGTNAELAGVVGLFLSASGAGFQLQQVALNTLPAVFQGTTLVISAAPSGGGNGFVDVGYINATGLDLNSVTIDGDLGQIDAGDANVQTTALRSLSAVSLGVRGLTTQATGGSLISTIFGGVGSLVLSSDLRDATFQVLGTAVDPDLAVHSSIDATAKIGAVKIGGSVIGGTDAGSGQIFAKGRIGTLSLGGNIAGGTGVESGRVWTEGGIDSAIIEGSIIGGTSAAATSSGQLFAGGKSSKILVKGALTGGVGADSGVISNGRGLGSVTILGGIEGGDGDRSGTVASAARISLVSIVGGVQGGAGDESGVIRSTLEMKTVKIVGDVRGGSGDSSGLVGSEGVIGKLTVEGSVIGGLGAQSGALGSIGALGDVRVTHLVGGSGPRSGQIVSESTIRSVTVDAEVQGGAGFESGSIGSFGDLGPVKIAWDLRAGTGDFSGTIQAGAQDPENGPPASIARVTITGRIDGHPSNGARAGINAGAILTDGALGPVSVNGGIIGGASERAGSIVAATIKSVFLNDRLIGGEGESSGVVQAISALGSILVQGSVVGGGGESSGAIRSGGSIGAVTFAQLVGGSGDFSGMIETQGEPADSTLGPVRVSVLVIGGPGRNSGSIHSSGKLISIEVGTLRGYAGTAGVGLGSGSISSELDMGAVKITGSILGGTGDESGKITSGGKLTSLTVAGSITGGSGDYDTTAGDLDEIGQIFAAGALGPVKITGSLRGGDGAHSGEIRAGSIQSVTIGDDLTGGDGTHSGGLTSTTGDIGPVVIGGALRGGDARISGFIMSADTLTSLKAESVSGGDTRALISAIREIGSVTISGFIEFADIFAGFDLDGNFTAPAARIGTVTIGTGSHGEFSPYILATNIVASMLPGEDGDFGTRDDVPLSGGENGLSRIGSVIINGQVRDPIGQIFEEEEIIVSGQSFGIVADHVVRVIVAGQTIDQQAGPSNDFVRIGESTLAINEREDD